MADLQKEMFDEQKQEFLDEGYTEDDLGQCDRCYRVEPHEMLTSKYDQRYCECCYDDMFVSWADAFKRVSGR